MNKKLLNREKKSVDFTFHIKSVDETQHIIEGVFSTPDVDRHGEVVVQNGWDLENYKRNPVVLWAHQNQELPVAQMVEIGPDAMGMLAGKMKFAVEEYEHAATVYKLMVGGYLRAFSVGFSNNRYEVAQNEEVVYLTENELFEVSIVNVPANALALAKSKGIDVSSFEQDNKEEEKTKDEEDEKAICAQIAKNIQNDLRGDKSNGKKKKVETPQGLGVKKYSIRKLNGAIRKLLKEKRGIKKV
jgi:HK97 family phage prohead protease